MLSVFIYGLFWKWKKKKFRLQTVMAAGRTSDAVATLTPRDNEKTRCTRALRHVSGDITRLTQHNDW